MDAAASRLAGLRAVRHARNVKLRGPGLVVVFAAVVFAAPGAEACYWDNESLMHERSRFPTALELMTGKFLRHTPEFYTWRVQDRLARIAREPDNLALVDDLAVGYDKLGQHAEAITAALAILPRDPRRYETLANLGTFYLHSGDFERGIEFIDRALEVNPDAHFGRERYQRWLAEYIVGKRAADGSLTLPLFSSEPHGFELFLAAKRGVAHLGIEDSQAAVKGVLGMMRFGKHDSAILCEALGDLLNAPTSKLDAKLLAARAYLMAAHATTDPVARASYSHQAKLALSGQQGFSERDDVSIEGVKKALRSERAEADAWYAELAAREIEWIRDSPDPEAEIRKLYVEDPVTTGVAPPASPTPFAFFVRNWMVLAAIALFIIVIAAIGRRMSRPPEV